MSYSKTMDPIEPSHYKDNKIQPIDAIESWELDFCLGNVVKYVARAGKKDPSRLVEDLEKAAWYLNRFIERKKSANHSHADRTIDA